MKPYRRRKIDLKEPVEVYRNLNRGGYTIRQGGKVRAHADELVLLDVEFVVSGAGHARCLRTGVRNVHAWAKGYLTERYDTGGGELRHHVRYSPWAGASFWWSSLPDSKYEGPLNTARLVLFKVGGVTAWRINDW